MGSHQPIRKHVTPEIPDKLYFRIGDVARLCEVPAYVLRFWETEFPQLKPNKGGTGQRLYRRRDVEMALRIKSLLYDQGYTIPGARQVFKSEARAKDVAQSVAVEEVAASPRGLSERPAAGPQPVEAETAQVTAERQGRLRALRVEMVELLTMLSGAPGSTVPNPNAGLSGYASSTGAKLQAMRPRLVSDSQEVGALLKLSRPGTRAGGLRPSASEDQPDLFSPASTQFE